MSRIFASEISKVASRTKQLGGSLYRIPWYIAFGEPLAGKSSAIRAMNLIWDKPQTMDGQYCQYWMSNEAVIIEGRATLAEDVPDEVPRLYAGKYGAVYPPSSVFSVRPVVAFGLIEHEAEFAGAATRWTFPD